MLCFTIPRVGFRLLVGTIAAAMLTVTPIAGGAITPAQAQVSVSAHFRTALDPYGRWERHARWGEVWIPANRPRDWRPYTVGHWVYTDDWGWYWIEDEAEASWGWVTYHYGRWAYDDDQWVWIPAEEWGPAWVQWRRGSEAVGWAPLPPDDVIVEYRDRPDVWIFVRSRDFTAPRIARVVIPYREYPSYFHETVVVNRTVVFSDRRFAVNPGIPAALIAASLGRPLRTYDVRPRVFAGTTQIRGAVEVRPDDLRRRDRMRERTTVRETRSVIRPADRVPDPQPLAAGERGRLGDNPPRAAQREGRQGTEGRGAPEGKGKQPSQAEGKGRRPPQSEGRGAERTQPPQTEERRREERRGVEGRGRSEQKQGVERREQRSAPKQAPGPERRARPERREAPATEGRREPQQMPRTQGRGGVEQQRQMPRSEGRGGAEQRPMPNAGPRGGAGPAPRTEGRGGGGGAGQPAIRGGGGGERRGGQPGER